MTTEEKENWVFAVATLVGAIVYYAIVVPRLVAGSAAEVQYVAPLLWTMGGVIIASILGSIAIAVAWPQDADERDVRDKQIHRYGEYVGNSFMVVGAGAALVLAMLEADHFWIANAVYLAGVLAALLSSALKAAAYRGVVRGW